MEKLGQDYSVEYLAFIQLAPDVENSCWSGRHAAGGQWFWAEQCQNLFFLIQCNSVIRSLLLKQCTDIFQFE